MTLSHRNSLWVPESLPPFPKRRKQQPGRCLKNCSTYSASGSSGLHPQHHYDFWAPPSDPCELLEKGSGERTETKVLSLLVTCLGSITSAPYDYSSPPGLIGVTGVIPGHRVRTKYWAQANSSIPPILKSLRNFTIIIFMIYIFNLYYKMYKILFNFLSWKLGFF